ncbi:hypothetical protein ACRQ5Q_08440 [Bradyrhizobium sp. PMVTL-01]|uniref:hypothetical protein n=1 Tax=Bradyrhizobium sp. PMVTL-01 TaxID=3434999 RepID=UPI003F72A705
MDAGLVRKLNDQCRFLPVRHELPAAQLPPLLSGALSPAIDSDEAISQMINDIHGVVRRPSRGSLPESVKVSVDTQTGYSAAANAVARLFVERSEGGLFGDPIVDVEELAKGARPEYRGQRGCRSRTFSFLKVSPPHVMAKAALFSEFDRYCKPWNPAKDALRLAADIMSDRSFPSDCRTIADGYRWEPRRFNAAIQYLFERNLIVDYQGIGTAPWAVFRVVGNDNMRRFVKSRSWRQRRNRSCRTWPTMFSPNSAALAVKVIVISGARGARAR